jgi:hypothetical protein
VNISGCFVSFLSSRRKPNREEMTQRIAVRMAKPIKRRSLTGKAVRAILFFRQDFIN